MRRLVLLLAFACSSPSQSGPKTSATTTTTTTTTAAPNAIVLEAAHEVTSEEVTFTADGRTVGGTITAPAAPGKWPAVLVLAGSGPTDRDWKSPLLATKNGSGALLATTLSKHGAVVLRFDKAGSGSNPGPPPAAWTIDTYRDEARAALALLRARPNVRTDRVFVAGHSEGGIHATRLAQVEQVAGIVYLASASRTLADTLLAQIEAQLRNPMAMLSEKAIESEMTSLRKALDDFVAGKSVDPQQASRIPQLQQLVAQLVNPATATMSRALLGFDTAAEAPKLAGPFFVFAGGKDIQVDVERDAKRLEKALREAGRDVTFHVSPDADHVLKHEPKSTEEIRANLQAAQDAYNAEGRVIDPDFVRALVGWLSPRSR